MGWDSYCAGNRDGTDYATVVMNVYIISGIVRDVPMETILKGFIPFVIIEVCSVILLVAFPQIALFLPGLSR